MAVLRQELPPHLHVAVFHPREAAVEVGLVGVPLRLGQLAVQEGCVRLVLEVMQPDSERVGWLNHALR
jgi:hypothetical protein